MRWVKGAEIGVMTLAALAFGIQSAPFLLFVLFLNGLQSTVFWTGQVQHPAGADGRG